MRLFFCILLPIFAHTCEILTISDAILDHIQFVDDQMLKQIPGEKGGSMLVDNATFYAIIDASNTLPTTVPGGSAVNSIKGLASLGHSAGLITTVGDDEEGRYFLESLKKKGISLFLGKSSIPTGKCACLVSADGERTMRTFLGASTENGNLLLNPEMFQGISHFHLEGYQLFHPELVKNALKLAKEAGATTSLDLSSFEIARMQSSLIWELLESRSINLLFCNAQEASILTTLPPQAASFCLSKYCDAAIVTLGERGCFVCSGTELCRCPALKVPIVDTIGAGDLFISGFLHGYLTKQPLETCTRLGTLIASHVVQVIGAEIPDERWDDIQKVISARKRDRE